MSTWRRSEAVRRVARRAPIESGTAEEVRRWVEATTDQVVAETSVVPLTIAEPPAPAALQRRDGASVYDHPDATRYTTLDTLAVEQRILDHTEQGAAAGRGLADAATVDAVLATAGLRRARCRP